MPDFTIVTMAMCSSLDIATYNEGGYIQTNLFREQAYPHCTCPAYKFAPRSINFGGRYVPEVCKHIRKIEATVCGWHEQWGISQITPGICPQCGEPTVPVRVAV